MLINQTGPAMQAGPRNYDRSFIRDGSATAAVLLRMGLASIAREYLRWYAEHAVQGNGLVSPFSTTTALLTEALAPISNMTARVNSSRWLRKWRDSTAGAASVREYLPKVRRTLEFLAAAARAHPGARLPGYERGAGTVSRHHRPVDQPRGLLDHRPTAIGMTIGH